jgi:signal transduction histidine kinase
MGGSDWFVGLVFLLTVCVWLALAHALFWLYAIVRREGYLLFFALAWLSLAVQVISYAAASIVWPQSSLPVVISTGIGFGQPAFLALAALSLKRRASPRAAIGFSAAAMLLGAAIQTALFFWLGKREAWIAAVNVRLLLSAGTFGLFAWSAVQTGSAVSRITITFSLLQAAHQLLLARRSLLPNSYFSPSSWEAGLIAAFFGMGFTLAVALSVLEEVERANRLRQRFLSAVSHELRTPLAGVTGMADLLKAGPLTLEQSRLRDVVAGSADHIRQELDAALRSLHAERSASGRTPGPASKTKQEGPRPVPPAPPTEGQDTRSGELRVLLAEDNAVNQLILRRQVERLGHHVTVWRTVHPPSRHGRRMDLM